jgi:hypothetical protein
MSPTRTKAKYRKKARLLRGKKLQYGRGMKLMEKFIGGF